MLDLLAEIAKYMNTRGLTVELFLAIIIAIIAIQRLYATDKKIAGILTEMKNLITAQQSLLTLVKNEFLSISNNNKEQDREFDKRFENIFVWRQQSIEKLETITDHLKEIKKTIMIFQSK